ncbi:hypothetical protein V6Z79_009073 [Aspergillus fumigatus]|nr:hypothetical protein KXV90_003739 [Aspergillus fumigatus]
MVIIIIVVIVVVVVVVIIITAVAVAIISARPTAPATGAVATTTITMVIRAMAVIAIAVVVLSARPITPTTGAGAVPTVSAQAAAVRLAIRLTPAAFLIIDARPNLQVRDHILGRFVLRHLLATSSQSQSFQPEPKY